MSLVKRATIKSYDAGSHRAAIGVAGSLSVWLGGVAVSDSIPAAAVVPGRDCSVLFHTDDNPADAIIVAIVGAGAPVGGGGNGDEIADGDADTYWRTEESADEDVLRGAVGGTERATIRGASPHHTLTGDAHVTNNLGVRTAPATGDNILIKCAPSVTPSGTFEGLQFSPTIDIDAGTQSAYSVRGTLTAKFSGGGSYPVVAGLDYVAAPFSDGAGTQVAAALIGAQAAVQTVRVAGTLNVTFAAALQAAGYLTAVGNATSITDLIGVNIQGPVSVPAGGITRSTGLRIEHIAHGAARYLAHAFRDASLNTSLRLDAGLPPDAGLATEGDSQLLLAWMENGTVNVRRVRWRRQSSLGSTDRVLIAA